MIKKGGGYHSTLDTINPQAGNGRVDRWISKFEYRYKRKEAGRRVNRRLRLLVCAR